jgi:hypothetical protein
MVKFDSLRMRIVSRFLQSFLERIGQEAVRAVCDSDLKGLVRRWCEQFVILTRYFYRLEEMLQGMTAEGKKAAKEHGEVRFDHFAVQILLHL